MKTPHGTPTLNKALYKNQLPIAINDICHFLIHVKIFHLILIMKVECTKERLELSIHL